ncbi:beta-ketoacyl synthase [Kitasatospora sp. NBC_01300]|uniref:beta-ketoacyl-[acyl-carrier-protein] synthase family protein n=1 Tax=Kitasatospora sp. NBC_01300 TaxID=2903574 RepID=UPI00352DCC62|nr:beta-ketoacyl-[acyl-carrier-protein] synthase family protein [Kitasatospora sp. NBC_01300]WSK08251.1 beta-ketoacyl-[acyl-carrier-protein] synthase family protein [Kitasatospora sp. NBC_01300]
MAARPTRPPIAVTGLGVVSPAGHTPDAFWHTVSTGTPTATALTDPALARHRVRLGCRVTDLPANGPVPAKDARRLDPFAHYGTLAALAAHQDAGAPEPDPGRTAIVVGNAVGGRTTSDRESALFTTAGPLRVSPLMPLVTMPNAAAAQIAMRLAWTGPALTIATTCASSADAIGHAALLLETGRADIVIAGGCEATLTPVTLAAFGNLGAHSQRNDDPTRASRPFDTDRDGFVMGEGAGFLVLERLADARARHRTPYALLAGYGSSADAYHLSNPRPDGAGAVTAMRAALTDAGLTPADIAHVNAHGTSTVHNDRAEAAALRTVFGPHGVPVTSTKGSIGHLIGAAGAVELIAAVQAMNSRLAPPTANHEHTEQGLDLDVVHGTARPIRAGAALSNSFGFGGHNSTLVVTPL